MKRYRENNVANMKFTCIWYSIYTRYAYYKLYKSDDKNINMKTLEGREIS